MTEVVAMDDDQKDVAIIEASALLVTLIFIILSIYSSNSVLVTILEPFTYAVGFFFVVAASAAAIRLLMTWSAWALAGLRIIEFLFFWVGLLLLAVVFFFRAPRDVDGFVVLALVTLGMIGGPLLYAYHRRHMPVI
jgi:hypothetical protein